MDPRSCRHRLQGILPTLFNSLPKFLLCSVQAEPLLLAQPVLLATGLAPDEKRQSPESTRTHTSNAGMNQKARVFSERRPAIQNEILHAKCQRAKLTTSSFIPPSGGSLQNGLCSTQIAGFTLLADTCVIPAKAGIQSPCLFGSWSSVAKLSGFLLPRE